MKQALFFFFLFSLPAYAQEDISKWFPFRPENSEGECVFDATAWLHKPAGKHGALQIKGNDYAFEDGTRTKFWGVNICSDEPFSNQDKVREWVPFMAKHGINAVRFHKFTWDATDGVHSTKLTDEKWKKFDFFCNELKNAGIYYSWSHIYGHRVLKADSARLIAYQEVKETEFPWSHLNGTTASLVNFAEDLQKLNIELTVNMLEHVNPHTGQKYASDPALAFIELQNEDNIFWGAIEETLKQTPTYKALLCKKFSQWLEAKYKTDGELKKVWKNQGLAENESLESQNIYPHPNHGLFSHEYEKALKEKRPVPQYVADRATFLFEEQIKFYTVFIKAIRDTGYKGVIVGSCWQAGSGITHFYNLYSDYKAGAIDRHNYFGGGTGHRLQEGKFDNTSMLRVPGSGLLSTGFQMVEGRPFQLSEWMSLVPTEWIAESAPLIATYGMGLQGWDASFAFAMDYPHYTNTIQSGHGVYNVTSPTHLALYPAIARMIYRNDVKEGAVIANRNVDLKDLARGHLPFSEKTSQQYDVKSFQSIVPVEAMAIGAVTVSFDKTPLSLSKKAERYWDHTQKLIHSNTGQLRWHYGERGYFTIDTKGTKAFVGFSPETELTLGNVMIRTDNDFAVIFVSSLDPLRGIESANRLLITMVARARNTGMVYNSEKTELVSVGTAPILLEPVRADFLIKRKGNATLHILDHAGNRTGQQIKVSNGRFMIDGQLHKTLYYEIVFSE